MDTRDLRRKFYSFSYRIRDLFWLFTFIVVTVSIGPIVLDKVPSPDTLKPFEPLDEMHQYVLLGLWVILALIWEAFPARLSLKSFSIRFKTLFWAFTFIIVAAIIGPIILGKALIPDTLKLFVAHNGLPQYTLLGLWVILALIWRAFPSWFNLQYFSFRFKTLFWLFTFAAAIVIGPILLNNIFSPDTLKPFETLNKVIRYYLIGLWIILALIWLAFPAWFSLKFRYLAWWVSQIGGTAIRWLLSGWRPAAFLLTGVSIALGAREIIIKSTINSTINNTNNTTINKIMNFTASGPQYGSNNLTSVDFWTKGIYNTWTDFLMPDFWLKIFAVSALLALIYWAYQSRTRIVILQFTNQTGDDKFKSSAEGISSILLNELARLANLFKVVDEADPYAPDTQVADIKTIDPSLSVSDVGETLKNAVTTDTKVKLGILEVPVGAIIGVLGKVVEGPRLNGSLHKEKDDLVLIAKISGGGLKGDWRVSSSDLLEKSASSGDHIAQMTGQLAYRIFTDLEQEHLGSPRWKAICHYTDGLRAYRETLRTEKNKTSQLRRAEKAFLMALGEDIKFLQCHYNLGVVYYALRQPESAFSVLNKSVDPYQPEIYLSKVYYALARNHYWIQEKKIGWENTDYGLTLQLCDQAIKLCPEDAKAWDLMGIIKRRVKEQEEGKVLEAGKYSDYWANEIIPVREIATALAWRALCHCALKGQNNENHKKPTTTCTRNLAVAYSMADPSSGTSSGKSLFYQAIHLAPTDPELYFELGKTIYSIYSHEKWREAAGIFENALALEQRPLFWSYLALTNSKLYDRKINGFLLKKTSKRAYWIRRYLLEQVQNYKRSTLKAYQYTMDSASELREDSDSLENAKNAMDKLILCLLSQIDKKKSETVEDYKKRLEKLKQEQFDWDWGYAQVLLRLLDIESDKDKAKEMLREAMRRLERDGSPQMVIVSDLIIQLDKKISETEEDYKKRLEKLRQEQFDWDWGYAQVLLRLQAIENDKEIAGEMLKEAMRRLEKDGSPRMAMVSDLLSQLDKNEDEIDSSCIVLDNFAGIPIQNIDYWELSIPTPNSLPIADSMDLFNTTINYKEKLEGLKQKYFYWDWGYAQALLRLLDIESDKDNAEKMLKEATRRLEKCGSPKMAMVWDLLSQLDKKKSETDANYKKRLEELVRKHCDWDWGYAQVLLQLSNIENDKEKASRMLEEVIIILKKYHPQVLLDRGVHAWLAQTLVDQKKFNKSLYHAQDSVVLCPERAYDRSALSKVCQSLGCFDEASLQLRVCLSLEPENSQYLRDIGYAQSGLTPGIKNKDDWRKSIYKYIDVLSNSLELLESKSLGNEKESENNMLERIWRYYWLGEAYYEINRYDNAISNWIIAINLSEQSQGRSDLLGKLCLGRAYLKNRSFNEVEDRLNGLIEDARSLLKTKGALDYVGQEVGYSDITIAYLLVSACLDLAFSYAERDAIDKAFGFISEANEYIRYLGDGPRKTQLEAMLHDRKGWTLYKQVKLGIGTSDIKDATKCLEEAVCKRAEPEYYLHLALALEYMLETKLDETEADKPIAKNGSEAEFKRRMDYALACCDHAIDLDLQEKYTEEAKELKKRLKDLKRNHSKATTASKAKSELDPNLGYA